MRKTLRKSLSALCAAALLLGLIPLGATTLAAGEKEEKPTLWIVGDSTVCDFGDADASYYYPRYGYGTQIAGYLDGSYSIENLALSGRSSLSFLAEDNYQTLKNGMQSGDALIIGFGHNDEKADTERYTNPNGDWRTEGSFAECLWTNYVEPAQAKGVEVILCTPIVRRTDGAFSDSQLHVTSDSGEFPGGDYPAAIRALGAAKGCAVVDLTALTHALYDQLTPAETLYLHAWTSDSEASVDNTHLNVYGAKLAARMLCAALKETSAELGRHVSAEAVAAEPAREKDLAPNPEYVVREYTRPVDGSGKLGEAATVANAAADRGEAPAQLTFYPTAFGDLGGAPTTGAEGNFHFTREGDTLRVAAGLKGKVASSTEGLAMYYLRLPLGAEFAFSATATLNGVNADSNPNQSAFGIMARDDMYIDESDSAILGDYVAAGSFADGHSNCFYRRSGALGLKDPLSAPPEEGRSYKLSIVSFGEGYTCTFGDEEGQSGGFDFQLNAKDSQYFYLCLFAARNMDVTFSDISLKLSSMPSVPSDDAAPAAFADLPAGHWAKTAAESLAARGIFQGTDDTHFSPDVRTSRAMIVTLLWRMEGEPQARIKIADYPDVADGSWYTGAVRWAREQEIVTGYADDTFGPNDPVTREQLAAILYRYARFKNMDVSAGEDTNILSYDDASSIGEWAIPAMQWAVGAGIIRGAAAGALSPRGQATRAETAVMLERFLGLADASSAETPRPDAEKTGAATLLYMGQGSLRVVTAEEKVIYIDPFSGDQYDLPADLILVTHDHPDHNQIDLVETRNDGCRVITHEEALRDGRHQTFDLGYVTVEAVEAGYNRNHDVAKCVGYVLTFSNGRSVYVTGDTSTTEQMPALAEKEIDYAFFCCDGKFNMDTEEASACARLVGAKHSIPYHMAPGGENNFSREIAEQFQAEGRIILAPGEELPVE